MAGKSPGKKKSKQHDEEGKGDAASVHSDRGGASTLSRGASNLAQRVGSLFGGGGGSERSSKRGRKDKGSTSASEEAEKKERRKSGESGSRVEVAYHGRRTDARDRSSEDPRRHHIPRASVTPTKSRSPVPFHDGKDAAGEGGEGDQPPSVKPRVKLRRKSLEREMERRASRERELERERRPRERSRSRERMLAELSSTEQAGGQQPQVSSTSPERLREQSSTTSSSRVVQSSFVTTTSSSVTSTFQSHQQQQQSLVRSSSSVTSSAIKRGETAEEAGAGGSPTRRQASFRVERNLQLSRSELGIPPVPPPRARTPKSPGAQPTPPPTETSFDFPDATSTPAKKTPYQFWREQRLLQREDTPSSSSSLMHSSSTSTVINTLQQQDIETVQQQQSQQSATSTTSHHHQQQHVATTSTEVSSSTGAVRKKQYVVDNAATDASSTSIGVAMHAATTEGAGPVLSPPEKAEDILARWKRERAKRERNASGASAASSSTAEPARKFHHFHQQQQPVPPEGTSGGDDKKDSRKTSAIASMFHSITKRKSSSNKEEKYSTIGALLRSSAPLDPVFHDTVLHPSEQLRQARSNLVSIVPSSEGQERQPVLGTVLKPRPPRSSAPPAGATAATAAAAPPRTPFEEWRHYRSRGEEEDKRPKRISAPAFGRSYSPLLSSSPGAIASLRARTPDPDYDSASIASTSSRSSYGGGHRGGGSSSREDLRRQVGPQFYGAQQRSNSSMGIPRYNFRQPPQPQHSQQYQRPPSSMVSASPRLENPPLGSGGGSRDNFFGRHQGFGARLPSAESQMWYQDYSHEAFPHEAVFDQESAAFGVHNFDVRIHSIRGKGEKGEGGRCYTRMDIRDGRRFRRSKHFVCHSFFGDGFLRGSSWPFSPRSLFDPAEFDIKSGVFKFSTARRSVGLFVHPSRLLAPSSLLPGVGKEQMKFQPSSHFAEKAKKKLFKRGKMHPSRHLFCSQEFMCAQAIYMYSMLGGIFHCMHTFFEGVDEP